MAEVSDSDDESQLSMMRKFLALLAAKAAWAALAQAATFTGSGTDDRPPVCATPLITKCPKAWA
jgi:hypothetical protein